MVKADNENVTYRHAYLNYCCKTVVLLHDLLEKSVDSPNLTTSKPLKPKKGSKT